jgi:hypothetical protein
MRGRSGRVPLWWILGAAAAAAAAGAIALAGASRPFAAAPGEPGAPAPPFVDVTAEAGIRFSPGLPEGMLNIREIAGSGAAFLDYDRDGHQDLVLLGTDRTALYRNLGNGRFEDVTAASGLPQRGQWIGAAAADYDNDGYPDVFLCGYDCAALLRNDGGKRFTDVTAAVGLRQQGADPLFATSAAWGDVDGDGFLDLYVARYLKFREGMPEFCRARSGATETCQPDQYPAQTGSLYRSLAGRRFEDVTRAMGADRVTGKAWGAVFFDFDGDGWRDLYLANDEVPGDLLKNHGGRRFTNVGVESGVAYDADGRPHGAMGADAGDYDGDGRPDLVVTTFYNEAYSLYRNNGDGTFTDRSAPAGIGVPTIPWVGWGTRLFDYDRDGWLDLIFVNGHATDSDRHPPGRDAMRQPMQLFRNAGGHFVPADLAALAKPILGRGAAFGDYDNDGGEDILVMDIGGAAMLLRNRAPARSWIGLELVGRRSNRDALGARVTVTAGGRKQVAEVRTCGSLFSSHDPRLRFGLADAPGAESVEIRWPGGARSRLSDVPAGRYVRVEEP